MKEKTKHTPGPWATNIEVTLEIIEREGDKMNSKFFAIAEIKRRAARQPSLLEAAKAAVALSGWNQEKQVMQTSAMAIDVLRKAIEREENPTFELAPDPIDPGVL